ncbi:MAG: hypothetical protein MSR67_08025 [Oscillospiraceae bacterium]|nr:hypothetical protein [Oscillospiraceae bacterium]
MKWRCSDMTAQSSVNLQNKPFYKFLPYFLTKLRFLRPQMIMTGIFALLSYPLVGIFVNMWTDAEIRVSELNKLGDILTPEMQNAIHTANVAQSLAIMSIVIGSICLVGMFVFTFVTTLRSFRYLYSKTAVDMDYALPVNHNTRFFADLAAVFTTSIIPHFFSVLVGIIFTNVISDKAKVFFGAQSAEKAEMIEMVSSIVLQCMFVGLFACFMQIAFSLLMISTSGKKAVAAVFPVLINIAIPIIHALGLFIIENNTYGSETIGDTIYYPAAATSPVGMLAISAIDSINYFWGVDYGAASTKVTLPIFRAEYLITAILLTMIFFVGAYFLIKFRRTERVGNAYVFKGMSVIIPGIVVLAMSLPMWNMAFAPLAQSKQYTTPNDTIAWIMGLLISTFIVYVILELISGKAFRKFHITVAKWAGSVVVCAGITAVLVFSNGFGKAEFVPAPEQVVRADVHLFTDQGKNPYKGYAFGIDETTDKDKIADIVELHKKVPKYKTEDTSDYVITLNYVLASGEVVSRGYWISPELYSEIMTKIVTPENWLEEKLGYVKNALQKTGAEVGQIVVTEYDYTNEYTFETTNEVYLKPSEFDVNRFLEAIRKDSEKMNFELYWNSSSNYTGAVEILIKDEITRNCHINIEDWMENTIEYLNTCVSISQN